MGLDITAYEIVNPEAYAPNDFGQECDWEDTVMVYNIAAFAARQDGLPDGRHKVDGRIFEFRAGSYSSYSLFREALVEMLGYEGGLKELWPRLFAGDEKADLEAAPFMRLINFADNEGVLGPKTCAKLAREFRQFLPAAEKKWAFDKNEPGRASAEEYYLDTYRHFLVAFSLAAGAGCVSFG